MEVIREEVRVKTGDEQMPCHLARPARVAPHPGLIVVMEAFGLNNHIKRLTERFAAEGFVAFAPNLYFRQRRNVVEYNDLAGAMRLKDSLSDDQVVADMGSSLDYLAARKEVRPVFATTGFCMGGRIAFLTACRNGAVSATVPFYGGGMVTARRPGEQAPIKYAGELRAAVLAFFGGQDALISAAEVETFRDALERVGKSAEVVVYEDADHGFMCEERPSYHVEHAKQAWEKTVAFLKQHLR